MKNIFREVVRTMSSLSKCHYTFEITSWEDWNEDKQRCGNGYSNEYMREKYKRKEFYGDYKVDFIDKTACIIVNSNQKQLLNEVIYYKDKKVFTRREGRGWDILKLNRDDYFAHFEHNGVLSLFAFDSFDTNGMTSKYEGENIVLENINLPKIDFNKNVYWLNIFDVKIQVDKLTNIVQIVMIEGANQCCSSHIRYIFKLFAVNEMVKIEEPF